MQGVVVRVSERGRTAPPERRVCLDCRLAGMRSLADGSMVHWCLQSELELGRRPATRPACSDFVVSGILS